MRPRSPNTLREIDDLRRTVEVRARSTPIVAETGSASIQETQQSQDPATGRHSPEPMMNSDEVISAIKNNLFLVKPSDWESGKHLDQALALTDQLALRLVTCSICYNTTTDTHTTPCNHVFCKVCINRWLENNDHCPSCRGKLPRADREKVRRAYDMNEANAALEGAYYYNSTRWLHTAEPAQFVVLNEQNEDAALVRPAHRPERGHGFQEAERSNSAVEGVAKLLGLHAFTDATFHGER